LERPGGCGEGDFARFGSYAGRMRAENEHFIRKAAGMRNVGATCGCCCHRCCQTMAKGITSLEGCGLRPR